VVGGFFQVFGLGNMYAGNIGVGLLFLFGYWFVAAFFFVVSILTCTGWLVLPLHEAVAVQIETIKVVIQSMGRTSQPVQVRMLTTKKKAATNQ
jgi:TM2 domain-containing membrane protein YozV